tara:strand:- start:436 stop:687 length:252 start_codon:yes stop_codon:yes gene_type:complete
MPARMGTIMVRNGVVIVLMMRLRRRYVIMKPVRAIKRTKIRRKNNSPDFLLMAQTKRDVKMKVNASNRSEFPMAPWTELPNGW